MSWQQGPRLYGTGQNNPFQGPQGPRPQVPQPRLWYENAQGTWQQNPAWTKFQIPKSQGQRFQTPQQNQQNNTDYQDLNQQRRNTRMTTTVTTQWLAVITSFASKQSFNK